MEVTQETQQKILELNHNAMGLLKFQSYSESLNLLKESVSILALFGNTVSKFKLLGITYNNLGCYYKHLKKPKLALSFLKKAYESEKSCKIENVNHAGTLLNMCAIYSELGKHKKALAQSLLALNLLKDSEYSPNLISTLIIAYHNTGVEYEFLKQGPEALDNYKTAWDIALKYLGPESHLTMSMHQNYVMASKAVQQREIGHIIRYIEKNEFGSVPSPKKSKKKKILKFEKIKKNVNNKEKVFVSEKIEKNFEFKPLSSLGIDYESKRKSLPKRNLTPLGPREGENTRYLTGNRLRPMNLNKNQVNSIPISPIRVHSPILPSDPKMSNRAISTAPISKQENSMRRHSDSVERKKKQPLEHTIKEEIISNYPQSNRITQSQRTSTTKSESPRRRLIRKASKDLINEKNKHMEKEKFQISQEQSINIEKIEKPTENNYAPSPKEIIHKKTLEVLEELENLKTRAKLEKIISSKSSLKSASHENLIEKSGSKKKIFNLIVHTQAAFRSYSERKKFEKMWNSAIVIQKNIRRFQCQKLFKHIKDAVTCIQSFYRRMFLKTRLS